MNKTENWKETTWNRNQQRKPALFRMNFQTQLSEGRKKMRKWNFQRKKSYFPTLGCLVGSRWGRLERKHCEQSERAEEEKFMVHLHTITMICGSVVRELGIWIESSAPGCIAISYWLTFRRMTFSSFIVWRRKHCHCCDEWKHFHSISRVDSCAFQWKSGWKVKRESSPSLLPPVTVSCVLHIQHVRFKCFA